MASSRSIVITSISAPNRALGMFAKGAQAQGIRLIIIGDTKSPAEFSLPGAEFYSIAGQLKLGLPYAQLCPEKHYARKNIGYLLAMRAGVETIVDTDDDNLPRDGFWDNRSRRVTVPRCGPTGWINVYHYFSEAAIWPRGLPLDRVRVAPPDFGQLPVEEVDCPIQQGLADENPDVDAIYRLLLPLPQNFRQDRRVALAAGTWCPFNSQNTTWFRPAFPLLYLPAYCSFRMTDIWRSFVAQRIAWENGWSILFHEPTVWQERNAHNLMNDFADEVVGYLNNDRIARTLAALSLRPGVGHIPDNLRICYESLVVLGLVDGKELPLLEAWLAECK